MHPWKHYVAIGDSFTAGLGDAVEGIEPLGTADRLAAALRRSRPGLRYTNLAQPGLTSAEIRAGQLELALSLAPDLVSVVAGANDILGRAWDPERFEADLRRMFEALVRLDATLVTATLPNFPLLATLPGSIGVRLHRHILKGNAIIQRLASDFGAICLDLMPLSTLFDPALWSVDGIHPNARGYLEITSRMIQRLECQAGVSI
jgi:lysophospholipase L1-like esterase